MILFIGHSGKGETTGTKNKSVVSRACSEKRVGQQRNKEDIFHGWYSCLMGLPGGSVMKNPPASAEDAGSISGPGALPHPGIERETPVSSALQADSLSLSYPTG